MLVKLQVLILVFSRVWISPVEYMDMVYFNAHMYAHLSLPLSVLTSESLLTKLRALFTELALKLV